jgi:glycogen operon protein
MNWFDWSLVRKHADVHRFVRLLLARRLLRDVGHEQQRVSLSEMLAASRHAWHGTRLNQPDWGPDSHAVALGAELQTEGLLIHLTLNAFWEPLDFELPARDGRGPWRRWIDTSRPSPEDIVDWESAPPVTDGTYRAGPRSVVMLFAQARRPHAQQKGVVDVDVS